MKYILFVIFTVTSIGAFSQAASVPVIKQGTKLNYSVVTNDGTSQIIVKLDSLASDYVKFTWSAPNQGSGTWVIKGKSLQNANSFLWSQLEPDKEVQLTDDQSIVVFSRAQWTGMQKDKKTQLDMVTYVVKTVTPQQQFKLNDKAVDALYLENDNGSSKIWVLNNPGFPVVLKIQGNTAGPDVELKSVD